MGNGLCPECGCLLEHEEIGHAHDDSGEPTIIEIVYYCPCCQYTETTYED